MTTTPVPSSAKRTTKRSHGMSRTIPYMRWAGMMSRCERPGTKAYRYYGANGIRVCKEWLTFEAFWHDMKDGYFEGGSLDRIDNSKGYSKSNCRWVTEAEQRRHKKNVFRYPYKGRMLTLEELASIAGIKPKTMYCRLVRLGWTVERATQLPANLGNKHRP